MKKGVFLISFVCSFITYVSTSSIAFARAGGGSSSSSNSGSGWPSLSSSSDSSYSTFGSFGMGSCYGCRGCCCHSYGYEHGYYEVIRNVFFIAIAFSVMFLPTVIKKLKAVIYNFKARKQYKFKPRDLKKLRQRVKETYFVLQKAWTEENLQVAKNYITEDLFTEFDTKFSWMKMAGRRNVLENIKLINFFPVYVSTCKNGENFEGKVCFYIKGKMIDYIINTQTQEMIDGSTFSKPFVEYWYFTKNEDNNNWLLSKIKQENEVNF